MLSLQMERWHTVIFKSVLYWHFPRFSEMLIMWSLYGHQVKCLGFTKLEGVWYWTKSEATLKNIGLRDFLRLKGSIAIPDVAAIPASLLCYSTIDRSLYLLFFKWWLCLPWPPLPISVRILYVVQLWTGYFVLLQSLIGHSDAEDGRNPSTLRESSLPLCGFLQNFNSQLSLMLKMLI